jgi:hypothetical protein
LLGRGGSFQDSWAEPDLLFDMPPAPIALTRSSTARRLCAEIDERVNAFLQRPLEGACHWLRNALAHAPAQQRAAVAAMLKAIFAQDKKADAEAQWSIVADALREKQPRLGDLMDASREDVLAYMDFPREHWPQIASTNPLERVNREIKRRADVVGIFPNDGAILRSSARSCSRPTTSGR